MPDATLNVHVEPEPTKRPPRTEHLGRLGPDSIALYIENKDSDTTREPVIIAIKQDGLLGRYSVLNAAQPILDLTPYGAFQKGISRTHANLHRDANDQLTIEDLDSANGTYVNGIRLEPHKPHPLASGDWIALGRLGIEIYLENTPPQSIASAPPAAANGAPDQPGRVSAPPIAVPRRAPNDAGATGVLSKPMEAEPPSRNTGDTKVFREVFSIDPGDIHHQIDLIEEAILKTFASLPQCELQLTLEVTARWVDGVDGPTLQAVKARSQALKSSRPRPAEDE
jgi:hypothetical protein